MSSCVNKIVINDVEYRPVSDVGPLSLVVADKGFIFVGELTKMNNGGVRLDNCRNVRKWLSGGFGGLTKSAEVSGAVLDPCQPQEIPPNSVVSVCSLPAGWLS